MVLVHFLTYDGYSKSHDAGVTHVALGFIWMPALYAFELICVPLHLWMLFKNNYDDSVTYHPIYKTWKQALHAIATTFALEELELYKDYVFLSLVSYLWSFHMMQFQAILIFFLVPGQSPTYLFLHSQLARMGLMAIDTIILCKFVSISAGFLYVWGVFERFAGEQLAQIVALSGVDAHLCLEVY